MGTDNLKVVSIGSAMSPKSSQSVNPITLTDGKQLLNKEFNHERIIKNGILAPGWLLLLCAPPKTGKTLLALDMAINIANNKSSKWLDFKIENHGKVLFMSGEGGGKMLKERLQKRELEDKVLKNINFWWPQSEERIILNKEDSKTKIIDAIRKTKAKVFFIDPMIRFHTLNENSTKDMAEICNNLSEIREKTGVAIVLIHHTRKSASNSNSNSLQEARGSSVLHGEIDTGLILKKSGNRLNLGFDLRWAENPKNRTIKINNKDLSFSVENTYSKKEGNQKTGEEEILNILKNNGGFMSKSEVAALANNGEGVGEQTAFNYLKVLLKEDKICMKEGKYNKKFYKVDD